MTVTRLTFKLDEGHNYIDLAMCMSSVLRTLVRQKQVFTVVGGQISDNSGGSVVLSTAPNFWYTKAAINRCFRAWKTDRARAIANAGLENSKSVAKFADFKVTLNTTSISTYKRPVYTAASSRTEIEAPDEWQTSSVVNEDGVEKHFCIIGNHTGAYYSATKGWISTRPIPDGTIEPDMPDYADAAGTGPADGTDDYKQDYLALLHNTSDSQPEDLNLVLEDNNNSPFDHDSIFGPIDDSFNLQPQAFVQMSTTVTNNMIAGFKALCGLIHINVTGGTNPILILDVMNTPEAF